MASVLRVLNRLLPFATPGTPFIQDIVHLAVLCALLYFAPQIQQRFSARTEDDNNANIRFPADAAIDEATGHPDATPEAVDRQPEDQVQFPQESDHNQEPIPGHNGPHEEAPAIPAPGPVPELPRNQNVGAKKAKSLARKDQRRAYHEFQRSQGDAQRARDAEGAEQREKALEVERERRRLAERALESRTAAEREAKRKRDEAAREENSRRTELVLRTVREGLEARRMCDLFRVARMVGNDVDEEWVERVLRGSGIVGRKGDVVTMITEMGWAVRVTSQDMARLYKSAIANDLGDEHGRIANEELAELLIKSLER